MLIITDGFSWWKNLNKIKVQPFDIWLSVLNFTDAMFYRRASSFSVTANEGTSSISTSSASIVPWNSKSSSAFCCCCSSHSCSFHATVWIHLLTYSEFSFTLLVFIKHLFSTSYRVFQIALRWGRGRLEILLEEFFYWGELHKKHFWYFEVFWCSK